jgi:hypothetical protein
MYTYLENQTCERSVVVVFLDTINQELRKRRHDLSVLAKPGVSVSKERTTKSDKCALDYSLRHDVAVSVLYCSLQCNLQHLELIVDSASEKRQFTIPLAIGGVSQRKRISLPSVLYGLHNLIEIYHASSDPVCRNTSMTALPESLNSVISDSFTGIV